MQHRIPKREQEIKFADLSQYLRSKYKNKYNNFQDGGQLHFKCNLYKARHNKKQERQPAQKYIFIVPVQQLEHQHHDHEQPESKIYDK